MSTTSIDDRARDESWVARIRQGDERAFEAMVRACYPLVYRMALRYAAQHALAEEVAQDVFVRVWERRADLDVRTGLVGYLLGAAKHRALNAVAPMRERASHVSDASALGNLHDDTTPEVIYDAAELSMAMRSTVDRLSPRAREVFLLSRRDGLTPAQIANGLGVNVQTVYTLLARALKQLQETLDRLS